MQWGDPPGGAPAPKLKIDPGAPPWGTSKLDRLGAPPGGSPHLESQYYFGLGSNLERKDLILDWFGCPFRGAPTKWETPFGYRHFSIWGAPLGVPPPYKVGDLIDSIALDPPGPSIENGPP